MTAETARAKGLTAFRDYVIDGQPSSGANNPDKPEIREFVDETADAILALEASQTEGFIVYAEWADLAAHPTGGLSNGAGAKVYNDAGTHTDPVVGGTVNNEGVYSYVTGSPSGFQRVANLEVEDAAAEADRAETEADRAEAAATAYFETVPTGENLFDPSEVREGYFVSNSTGEISAAAGWACSGFIPVTPGVQYTVSSPSNRQSEIGFYSSASDSANISGSSGSTTLRTVTAPVGAAFMVITVKSTVYAQPAWIMVNEGALALPYEPWSDPVTVLKEAALPLAVAAQFEGLRDDVLTEVPSVNLFNPANVRDGYYANSTTGLIGTAAGWACSEFIPVVAGQEYTISSSSTRQGEVGFYSAAADSANISGSAGTGTLRTVTAPVGAAYMVINVKSPTYPQPTWIMVNEGVTALAYIPWTPTRLAVRADAVVQESDPGANLFSRLVLNGAGSTESWVESNRAGFLVRNTFVYSPPVALTAIPVRLNLRKVYLDDALVRDAGDDIAPDVLGSSGNILGNHGYLMGRMTAAGHGKASADRGSVWTKGGTEHVLVDIVDANTLLIAVRASNSYPTTGTFTHVSGATNTANIVATATTGIQWYPPHNGKAVKAIVDGVETGADEGQWEYENEVKIVETVNLLARATIIEWWIANGGAGAGVDPVGDPVLIHTLTYHFDRDGQLTVYSDWLALEDQGLTYLRGLQVGYVGTPDTYYIPGALPFTLGATPADYSLGVAANRTISDGAAIFNSTNLKASGEYAHRLLSLWSDKVFATGLLPLADADLAVRRSRVANVAMDIAATAKVYFRTVDIGPTTMTAGTRYSVGAFRHIVPRTSERTAAVPVRTPSGVDFLFVDWHDKAGLDRIPVPADMVGRPFTVEDSHNVTAGAGILTGDLPVLLDAAGDYASLILKVT